MYGDYEQTILLNILTIEHCDKVKYDFGPFSTDLMLLK